MNTLRNRKHKKNNEHESSTSTEIIKLNNDNQISTKEIEYEKLLLSIQINGKHICTGTPVGSKFGFTTANCAIKVKMYLPDEDGTKVKVYYGEILGQFGFWTTVNGVTIYKEDPKSAILDESYQHRKLDFGMIRVSFALNNYINSWPDSLVLLLEQRFRSVNIYFQIRSSVRETYIQKTVSLNQRNISLIYGQRKKNFELKKVLLI